MENRIAVHECKDSEKVVKFIDQSSLNEEMQNDIKNGYIFGLYYDKSSIVAEDIWGDVHENIEK